MKKDEEKIFEGLNKFEITILAALSVAIVLGAFLFGMVGLFYLFGVKYDSVSSVLWFVLLFFIVGILSDVFANTLMKKITKIIKGKKSSMVLRNIIHVGFTFLTFYLVDWLVKGIDTGYLFELVAAILFVLLDWAFDSKEKENKQKEKKNLNVHG